MPPAPAPRRPPGPKPRLSRDEIVDVALRVLADEGSDALSLRRLGQEFGVTAMSMYGYFASRSDLEDAVVGRVMPAPPEVWDTGIPWHEELRRYVVEIHDAFAAQAGAARFLLARSTTSEAMDGVREHLLRLLLSAGISRDDAVSALGALSRYLMGCVVVEAERNGTAGVAEGQRLRELPADRFPALREVAHAYSGRSSVESTHFGLDLIIQGLKGLG